VFLIGFGKGVSLDLSDRQRRISL